MSAVRDIPVNVSIPLHFVTYFFFVKLALIYILFFDTFDLCIFYNVKGYLQNVYMNDSYMAWIYMYL